MQSGLEVKQKREAGLSARLQDGPDGIKAVAQRKCRFPGQWGLGNVPSLGVCDTGATRYYEQHFSSQSHSDGVKLVCLFIIEVQVICNIVLVSDVQQGRVIPL